MTISLSSGKNITFGNSHDLSVAYELSQIITAHRETSFLILAPNPQSALELQASLQFLAPERETAFFPDRETLPYDRFSPPENLTSERLALLNRLGQTNHNIVITAVQTALNPLPPTHFIEGSSFVLSVLDHFDPIRTRRKLETAGYMAVKQVMSHGEYALRGSIFDIFPMGAKKPFRLDLFDDEIESIRLFDPDTQRSIETVESINILPAHEFPLTQNACDAFLQRWSSTFPDRTQSPVLEAIKNQRAIGGLEYYLPLFFEQTALLSDYLPPSTVVVRLLDTNAKADVYWHTILERYRAVSVNPDYPPLAPERAFVMPNALFQQCNKHQQITFEKDRLAKTGPAKKNGALDSLPTQSKLPPYERLHTWVVSHPKLLLCCESAGRETLIHEQLLKRHLRPKLIASWQDFLTADEGLYLAVGDLSGQGYHSKQNWALVSENTLFGDSNHLLSRPKSKKQHDEGVVVKDLGELTPGTAVVHINHGIGRFEGLTTLDLNGQSNEFITLSYANSDKLYVPINDLHLLSRYSGLDQDRVHLNKLGTDKWSKAKEKALKKIHDVAAELLSLYAQRAAQRGHNFEINEDDYQRFADEFPYTETDDQLAAIAQVLKDMTAPQPMDRLLCGDVGFGKTEVAMRAAFVAASSGKQVAILGPTTLLVEQHFETFSNRFAQWPITVESLSRFKSAKQQNVVREQLAAGQIDIVIGTHALLSDKLQFKNLGLVVIDEEHRFGVRHKEKLKKLRHNVDVLSMTATPIPRTLNMALSTLRDLSVITTPPAKRLSIQTFVREYHDDIVKEAILREVYRGGQVYFLHNNVESIYHQQEELQKLLPEIKTEVAHGQMAERDLERIMADFYHNRFQILICTTIIETGIDVPNANTIIMDRADRLGLAQLHQLRGRVGRSHHQAYAYLLTPPWATLNRDAKKRLEAIQEAKDLGAGFTLANHDLEIRGAGDLLGDEQSGNMQAIGYDLYLDLLNKTVKAVQAGKSVDFEAELAKQHTQVELNISAILPDMYVADINQRLSLYQKIAHAETERDIDEIKMSIIDRFGKLPEPAEHLLQTHKLRVCAQHYGITKIDGNAAGIKFTFSEKPNIDPVKLIKLVQLYPNQYQFAGQHALRAVKATKEANERIEQAFAFLERLGQ